MDREGIRVNGQLISIYMRERGNTHRVKQLRYEEETSTSSSHMQHGSTE